MHRAHKRATLVVNHYVVDNKQHVVLFSYVILTHTTVSVMLSSRWSSSPGGLELLRQQQKKENLFMYLFFLFALPGHPELEPPRNPLRQPVMFVKMSIAAQDLAEKKAFLLEICVNGNAVFRASSLGVSHRSKSLTTDSLTDTSACVCAHLACYGQLFAQLPIARLNVQLRMRSEKKPGRCRGDGVCSPSVTRGPAAMQARHPQLRSLRRGPQVRRTGGKGRLRSHAHCSSSGRARQADV